MSEMAAWSLSVEVNTKLGKTKKGFGHPLDTFKKPFLHLGQIITLKLAFELFDLLHTFGDSRPWKKSVNDFEYRIRFVTCNKVL